jgi:hypothetical protein
MNISELKRHKIELEKLRTYADKVKYWDKIGFGNGFYSKSVSKTKTESLKNIISIFPKNEEQEKVFIGRQMEWYINNYNDCNPDQYIGLLEEKLTDHPLPKELVKYELDSIKARLESDNRIHHTLRGFSSGYESVIAGKPLPLSSNDVANFRLILIGRANAIYKGYLEGKLREIENGKFDKEYSEKQEKGYNKADLFFLLKELRLLELKVFKSGSSQEKKYELLAQILNSDKRTASKYFNNKDSFTKKTLERSAAKVKEQLNLP